MTVLRKLRVDSQRGLSDVVVGGENDAAGARVPRPSFRATRGQFWQVA